MNRKENLEITSFAERLKAKYGKIVVIISPPRCASTALARFLWHQPDFRYYTHEPYETVYYNGDDLTVMQGHLLNPLDLTKVYCSQPRGNGMIIKEMPYQVGEHFNDLVSLATMPLIFLIRDPKLNIKSKIDKRLQTKQPVKFPFIETGWELIDQQIKQCETKDINFVLIEATEMRNNPTEILSRLSHQLGLPFSPKMLHWQRAPHINLDNLEGKHHHLYERVLESSGIEAPTEPVPDITAFPTEHGLRNHVLQAIDIYHQLLTHSNRLKI